MASHLDAADQEKYGGWPASGEIDIMEMKGQEPNIVLGTLHHGGSWREHSHGRFV